LPARLNRSLALTPVASLGPMVRDGTLVGFDVGPDGVTYFVVALRPLDYRTKTAVGPSFPKTVPAQPQTYRAVGLDGSRTVLDVVIEGEPFNISHMQPLGDELLLVCSRCCYRGPDDIEKNGRVYSRDGRFRREILLGDGINSVQTTARGVIWTSYFDEGVMGNFGWADPVGASGLVAWDRAGRKLYEFEPAAGLEAICDCYALNVASENDVWLCYYTDFPLVRLRDYKVDRVWKMPLRGSGAFAVAGDHALFRGDYRNPDTYHLFALPPQGKPRLAAKLDLRDPAGHKLVAQRITARGDSIHLVSNGSVYRIDVPTALAG
jgi:hypothetical protein